MKVMVWLCGGRFFVHGCQHGLFSKHGDLLLKPRGWFSTHIGVRKALERKCSHGAGAHTSIHGDLTSATAVYPRLLCRGFAKVLLEDIKVLYGRFSQQHRPFQFDANFENAILANEAMDAIQEAVQPEAAPQDEAAPRAEEPDPGEIRDFMKQRKTQNHSSKSGPSWPGGLPQDVARCRCH